MYFFQLFSIDETWAIKSEMQKKYCDFQNEGLLRFSGIKRKIRKKTKSIGIMTGVNTHIELYMSDWLR